MRAYLFALILGIGAAAAEPPARAIAVLYPDIGEPYRSVFSKMIAGIEETAKGRVTQIAIAPRPNRQDIASELHRQDVRVAIVLGRNGLKFAANLDQGLGVVVGGVITAPEDEVRNYTVSSLTPDPAQLFARLRKFIPHAKRVFVVFDPNQNAWLMRLAKAAALERGIELVAYEAGDLKTAMSQYQKIIATIEPGKDALWIPLDTSTVDESFVMPMLLQEAWARNLTLFSSNAAHVPRGALFSLYPDETAVGRHLAEYALGYLFPGDAPPRGVIPLKAALLSVNTRTARHLGLAIADMKPGASRIFPEQ